MGSQRLCCQDGPYGGGWRLRHFAFLLCRWFRCKEACCSPKDWLELEEEQESSKQGPHVAKITPSINESQADCPLQREYCKHGAPIVISSEPETARPVQVAGTGLLLVLRRGPSWRGHPRSVPFTVRLVRFIKRAQELGFTLREIEELIELRESPPRGPQVRAVAAAKVEDIERRIRQLKAMRKALGGLVAACDCEGGAPTCPIIEALDDSADAVVAGEE
jgi:DNA-binding transcriptional MerR regulator